MPESTEEPNTATVWPPENRVLHPAPIALVPGLSDSDKAADYKDQIRKAMVPLQAVLTSAKHDGFEVAFAMGADAFGNIQLQSLRISKVYE